jgi:LysM repeat protein
MIKRWLLIFLWIFSSQVLMAQSANQDALSYIEQYKDLAISEMNKTGIPASITLAQALHESANGKSQLAVKANNHFGVKCTANWSGGRFHRNNNKRNSCFRKYESVEDAYADRSRFLSNNKKYAFLFQYGPTAYKKWAYGLQRSGYAASKHYASHLLRTIERYNLHQYDVQEIIFPRDSLQNDSLQTLVQIQPVQQVAPAPVYHKVRSGESLYSIAKKHHTNVNAIRAKNHLRGTMIKPGQKLRIR